MSISDISIPDISIPNISVQIIPPVRVFGGYISHPSFSEPSLLLPGCYKTHRDADKNSNLVNETNSYNQLDLDSLVNKIKKESD